MMIGILFVILGIIVLLYPKTLVVMLAGLLIFIGGAIIATSWEFRRLGKHPDSQVIDWIIRW